VLLLGAIFAPGVHTVARMLRMLRLARQRRSGPYRRVLSRAVWSPLAANRILLGLPVRAFVPTGPVLVGPAAIIEPRRGARIRAEGISRGPTVSSRWHFGEAVGVRRLSFMLLAAIPWGAAREGAPGRPSARPIRTLRRRGTPAAPLWCASSARRTQSFAWSPWIAPRVRSGGA
jgi:hypothetical protein